MGKCQLPLVGYLEYYVIGLQDLFEIPQQSKNCTIDSGNEGISGNWTGA